MDFTASYTVNNDSLADINPSSGQVHRGKVWKITQKIMCMGCPYLENLEETVVKEIIFSDGDARFRTLQWLVGRFHPKFQELLFTSGTSMTTVPILTSLMADLGLCSREDYELVKGSTTVSRQVNFLDALLDLIDIGGWDPMKEIGTDTPNERLSCSMESCCAFMDNLSEQEDLDNVFPKSLSLIPPGIAKATTMECDTKSRFSAIQKSGPPTNSELRKLLKELTSQLDTNQSNLDKLSQTRSYQPLNLPALNNTQKSLLVSLDTLSQLATNFCHTYETEILPWTDRQTPPFTSLGPCCKRASAHRERVEKLMNAIDLLQACLLSVENMRRGHNHSQADELLLKARESLEGCLQIFKNFDPKNMTTYE